MSSTKVSSCKKVKNSCKICLEAVTKKNGLQCQGACQKWAHYKCLSFTPGKIQDIKAGLIQITCPCPDCNNTTPKEILTNPPYSCSKPDCPSNSPPICDMPGCASKEEVKGPIPDNMTMDEYYSTLKSCENCPRPRPPTNDNRSRKESTRDSPESHRGFHDPHRGSHEPYRGSHEPHRGSHEPHRGSREPYRGSHEPYTGSPEPYRHTSEPYRGSPEPYRDSPEHHRSSFEPYKCSPQPCGIFPEPYRNSPRPPMDSPVGSNISCENRDCPRRVASPTSPRRAASPTCPRPYSPYCDVSKCPSHEKKSSPNYSNCSIESKGSGIHIKCVPPTGEKQIFKAIEEICETVGQLSKQLNDLMCTVDSNSGSKY